MRKKFLMVSIILCLFLTIGFCLPSSAISSKSQVVKGPVLIDKLQNQTFKIQLIYSDITSQQIEVFNATPTHFSLENLSYTSFTEGFTSNERHNLLLNAINLYRAEMNLEPTHYYYNYIETEHYDFVSLSSGLDALYIINRLTGEVSTPSFTTPNGLEKQYIYHITEGADAIYILSAKANSYEAFWYALDPSNFEVIASKRFFPPTTAVKRNHYALDSQGTGYFVANDSLLIVSTTDTYSLPLNFTPDEVYYQNDQLYAFSISDLFLSYAVFDQNLRPISSGRVNLPNKEVGLVDSFLDNNILYTITYDGIHPIYRNYLTLYNLNTNEMIYCLALKENHGFALLGLSNPTINP